MKAVHEPRQVVTQILFRPKVHDPRDNAETFLSALSFMAAQHLRRENMYPIRLRVNGDKYELWVSPGKTLLQLLRDDLNLTGTKEGCDEGDCGACSIIFNDRIVNACLILAAEADNANITTIEGLSEGDELDPIQRAFIDKGAIQCGFCTPGMIMSTKALLRENPHPSEADIRHYLEGNLCRCTGYVKILDAVQEAVRYTK